jgi:hypothetical protein
MGCSLQGLKEFEQDVVFSRHAAESTIVQSDLKFEVTKVEGSLPQRRRLRDKPFYQLKLNIIPKR